MNSRTFFFLHSLVLIFSWTSLAVAQSTDNVAQPKLTPGYQIVSDIGGGNLSFVAYLEAGKSYECVVLAKRNSTEGSSPGRLDMQLRMLQTVEGPSGNVSANLKGLATPVVNADANSTSNSEAARLTLTPTVDGYYKFTTRNVFDDSVGYADGSGENVFRILCQETSLYGGFNTNINDYNFLELTNTGNSSITAVIKATNFDGSVLINNSSVVVGAGLRKDVDLHTPIGAAKYGSIVVTHDGPLGALTGYVSQYKVEGSSFSLSTSLPLATRERP